MERLFPDEDHRGWGMVRWLWALAMLITWLQRGVHFEERYTDAGAVLVRSYIPVNDLFYFSPLGGWLVYAVLLAAVCMVALGRWTKAFIAIGLVCHLSLCFTEGMNFKGYDRLLSWQAVCMLVAPGRVDGRSTGLPLARYCALITYCGLYGQTGWEKILAEPTWWEGLPLMYNMVHRNFGDMPLGVLISDVKWLMIPMSWGTLIFEAGFPVLYWIRRVRPWLLLLGLAFHLGILVFMNVPNFTFASIVMYPVLLMPNEYDRFVERVRSLWGRLRPQASPAN